MPSIVKIPKIVMVHVPSSVGGLGWQDSTNNTPESFERLITRGWLVCQALASNWSKRVVIEFWIAFSDYESKPSFKISKFPCNVFCPAGQPCQPWALLPPLCRFLYSVATRLLFQLVLLLLLFQR